METVTKDIPLIERPLGQPTGDLLSPPAPAPAVDALRRETAASERRTVIRRRDAMFRRALALADMVSVTAALAAVTLAGGDGLGAATIGTPLAFLLLVKAMGLYDRDEHLLHKSTLDEMPALFGISTLAILLVWLSNGLLVEGELDRMQVLAAWLGLFLLLVCLRSLARATAQRLVPVERCLLIGDAGAAAYLRQKLALSPAVKAELVGHVEPSLTADGSMVRHGPEVGSVIDARRVDRVILDGGNDSRDDLLYTIRELKKYGVKVSVLPEASRVAGSSVELDQLHGITLLGMRRFEFTRSSRLVKRGFDVAGSALGLIVLAPLMAVIAVAIRVDSPGRILFRQARVGRNGDEFEMLKFRSMVSEAEQLKDELHHLNEGAEGLFKIPGDPRVTRVGRFLRASQLDELPQLINVLRGEMSLVGPRPLIPEEDRKIEGWYRRRLDVPPGITGHWQVLGSSRNIPLAEMVKLDYLYVANWSLWGDIRLLLRTIPFLIHRRGV